MARTTAVRSHPRFAITSTPEQLRLAGELCREHPTVYMQTHLSENRKEIELVRELFPERSDYLDVYDHYGLVHDRSVFAHESTFQSENISGYGKPAHQWLFVPPPISFWQRPAGSQSAHSSGVATSIATDVGAGTSFNLFRTLSEAYKICQLQGQSLSALKALYMATLGNALLASGRQDRLSGPRQRSGFYLDQPPCHAFTGFQNEPVPDS